MEDRVKNLDFTVKVIQGKNHIIMTTTEDTKAKLYGQGIVVQGDTEEEAEEAFWESLEVILKYYHHRMYQADLWEPFRIGPIRNWKKAFWFQIFGINVYFRYGDNMKGGRYIPFTKLNIRILNYWRKKYRK